MKLGSAEQPSSKRAEDVRRRRAERSQKRISTVNTRVVNPVNPRPVVTRGNAFGTPIHRQAGTTNSRRQFYVTMDQASGTELRLPAIPIVAPGWRLASGLIAILMLVGIFSMWTSPYFLVSSVDVQGVQRLTPADINAVLKLEDLSVVELDAQAIQQQLTQAFPELLNVQVAVSLPNLVTVKATERQPIVAVQKGDNVTWVDKDGVLFPARGDAGSLVTIHTEDDLPLAPAPVAANAEATQAASADSKTTDSKTSTNVILDTGLRKVDPMLLAAAQELSQKLPPESQIVYSTADGLGWKDPQGWQVYIGKDLQNFEAKYELSQKIAQYVSDQGQKANLISVERLDAPFYRLEQ